MVVDSSADVFFARTSARSGNSCNTLTTGLSSTCALTFAIFLPASLRAFAASVSSFSYFCLKLLATQHVTEPVTTLMYVIPSVVTGLVTC